MSAPFDTVEELAAFLSQYGVATREYGTGKAKTLDQFLAEIKRGESRLLYDDHVLIRYFTGAIVYVYYKELKLHEDRQEFKDGRVRRREFDFLAEKMPVTENPDEAAARCLEEELGAYDVIPKRIDSEIRPHADSMSYPGILTIANLFNYEVELPKKHFDVEGYVEEQKDKTNYYVWRLDRQRLKGRH